MGDHRRFSTTTHSQCAALLLLPPPLSCLWLKGLFLGRVALLPLSLVLGRIASLPPLLLLCFAWHQLRLATPLFGAHEGYPALSSPAGTLDLVYPSNSSFARSRPVALLQLHSALSASTLLPGGSSRLPRLPPSPPWLRSVMVLHCLLD